MKKQKIISSIFIIFFLLIISYFKAWDYYENIKEKKELKNQIEYVEKSILDFDISKIEELEDVELYYTPYPDLIDKIIEKIDKAEDKVYIEVYMFTEKRIKNSVINAKKRWIDVKVILEKDPYMAYSINDKFFDEFIKNDIEVVWSDPGDYSFNHSKFMIIDELSIISTWNLSYSTFTKNRDFFVFTNDKKTNAELVKLFNYDYAWEKIDIYSENIVLSPNYSRFKIEKLIDSAERELKIYIQYFADEKITKKIIERKKDWIDIKIILAETAKDDDETKRLIENWVEVYFMEKYKMHSKVILSDETTLFVWSVNFSENSFDKNRELGLLIKNKSTIDKFLSIFNKDFIK